MKNIFESVRVTILITAAMLMALSGCSGAQGRTSGTTSTQETTIAEEANVTEETEDADSTSEIYSNTVYYVGRDIPADSYVITCTKTEYSMEVVVFSDEADYISFLNADKSTIGEHSNALEAYAWTNYFLYESGQVYTNLKNGNIILLDGGMCEFARFDTETSYALYPGLYIAGEDIACERMKIKCTSDYLTVTVFDNTESYLAYHKSERFTIGEESDAIAEHAASSNFIYTDYSTYVNLQDGMILMIEDGTGEYSAGEDPVIN